MNTLLNNARNEGETFEHYQDRRRSINLTLKKRFKGRPFYTHKFDSHGKRIPYRKDDD